MSKMFFTVMSVFAELEANLLSERTKKGLEATRLAVSDVVMPMLASTLTTVAAFTPMLTSYISF